MNRKIILAFALFCIFGCTKTASPANVDNVIINLEESIYHEKKDIEEVSDRLIEYFKNHETFLDCTLDEINYYESTHEREKNDEVYETIILKMIFTTGDRSNIAFNSEDTYHYDIIFVKKTIDSSWTLTDMGVF